ncbi:hypothetical protein FA95DRAFT_1569591 [Auriscalpium vulgare]|uniref:Uncharacterized protein n=1 Tax=Auriscalpium vulgare TaxID=40419 RepID=A0ACB8S7Q8_9AGAM|nr:hypothetical protein FA95DRAFT_1569591 [Auriscalpium vulgare]
MHAEEDRLCQPLIGTAKNEAKTKQPDTPKTKKPNTPTPNTRKPDTPKLNAPTTKTRKPDTPMLSTPRRKTRNPNTRNPNTRNPNTRTTKTPKLNAPTTKTRKPDTPKLSTPTRKTRKTRKPNTRTTNTRTTKTPTPNSKPKPNTPNTLNPKTPKPKTPQPDCAAPEDESNGTEAQEQQPPQNQTRLPARRRTKSFGTPSDAAPRPVRPDSAPPRLPSVQSQLPSFSIRPHTPPCLTTEPQESGSDMRGETTPPNEQSADWTNGSQHPHAVHTEPRNQDSWWWCRNPGCPKNHPYRQTCLMNFIYCESKIIGSWVFPPRDAAAKSEAKSANQVKTPSESAPWVVRKQRWWRKKVRQQEARRPLPWMVCQNPHCPKNHPYNQTCLMYRRKVNPYNQKHLMYRTWYWAFLCPDAAPEVETKEMKRAREALDRKIKAKKEEFDGAVRYFSHFKTHLKLEIEQKGKREQEGKTWEGDAADRQNREIVSSPSGEEDKAQEETKEGHATELQNREIMQSQEGEDDEEKEVEDEEQEETEVVTDDWMCETGDEE